MSLYFLIKVREKPAKFWCSRIILIVGLVSTVLLPSVQAQNDTLKPSKLRTKRLALVAGSGVALYSGVMIGLNSLWYKDYPRSAFHLFNDNKEWLQMDKIGHATTAYYVGKIGIEVFHWTGMKSTPAIILGGSIGLLFLSGVEVLDGYSTQWGFSGGDMLANVAGAGLVIGQQLIWKEQRIGIKFSYYPSGYPQYRPSALGKNFSEQVLKDYNAQSYWLSCNIADFCRSESRFPKWLNVAIGYGANGMTGALVNSSDLGAPIPLVPFERSRQYYLALDVELAKLKTKNPILNTVFKSIGFIKFPSPALEYHERNGFKWHWIHF